MVFQRNESYQHIGPGKTLNPNLRERHLSNATLQADLQDWLEIDCNQIDAGAFEGHITQFEFDDLKICREVHNRTIHKRGDIPEGYCTVSFVPERGTPGWFNERGLESDASLYVLPAGTEFDLYLPGPTSTVYAAFEQEALMAGARTLDLRAWDRHPSSLIALRTSRRAAFVDALQSSLELCRLAPPWLDHAKLHRMIMHNVMLAISGGTMNENAAEESGLIARRRKLQVVREAHHFIRAGLEAETGLTPSIVDICAHVSVSERTLQYSFRQLLQVTPMVYLRTLRLNRVHADLQHPATADTTVTKVATRYGFFHLGRFAQDYRRQFGQMPSQTLSFILR